MLTLILGGVKSGKTKLALSIAEQENWKHYYIATARPIDEEMKERIEKHKQERGNKWKTIEEPIELAKALRSIPENSTIVVDCLTTWLTNLLVENYDYEKKIDELLEVLSEVKSEVNIVLVSNEVGLGVLPESKLGRRFIDLIGVLHQQIAKIADKVYFVVCGHALSIK